MLKKKSILLILLTAVLSVFLIAGCTQKDMTSGETLPELGKLTIRVNPEVEVAYDKQGMVTAVTAKNEDGKKVLSLYDDYVGKSCEKVVDEVIELINEAGYFVADVDGNIRNIVIQFEPGSALPQPDFPQTLEDSVNQLISKLSVNANVVNISPEDYNNPDGNASEYISEKKAKEIVLAHAGLNESDITYTKVKMQLDDGVMEWEIDFKDSTKEYEYELNATSGKIIDIDIDMLDKQQAQKTTTSQAQTTKAPNNTTTKPTQQQRKISKDKAIDIALNHVGVKKSDVIFDKVKYEHDDGREIYKIEFYVGNTEHEFKISALSGSILKYESEYKAGGHKNNNQNQNNNDTSKHIGKDKAVEIALKHAGVSKSQAKFDDVELDYDDGRAIYEIEFDVGDAEYEYDIDAITGEIIKYDIDKD